MKTMFKVLAVSCLVAAFGAPANAIPVLQTYIVGSTAGSMAGDEETWFYSGSSFTLLVVGSYGSNVTELNFGGLIFSVPEGETGTVSIASSDGDVFQLVTSADGISPGNPLLSATEDHLTDVVGMDGWDSPAEFLPSDANFNNHSPPREAVSK